MAAATAATGSSTAASAVSVTIAQRTGNRDAIATGQLRTAAVAVHDRTVDAATGLGR